MPPVPFFLVGKYYRLRFELGETWIGKCLGEEEQDGKRLVCFDAGLRDGEKEPMIACIETTFLVSASEVPAVRPVREHDMLLWEEAP